VIIAPGCPGLPRVIGHRGAAARAPENTLVGLGEAVRQGARWVEVDVRLSADDVPFLLHDDTLERTTTGRGPAGELRWAELGRLDAGARFHERFAGEPVPTLAAALGLVTGAGLGIVLEVKPDRGREHALLAAMARELEHARPQALLVSSSDPAVLSVAARLLPDVPRAVVLDEPPPEGYGPLHDLGVVSVHCWERWLHGGDLEAALAAGVVAAYTVNDVSRARELLTQGVAAVFTDRPGELVEALGP
jgi:glycerophosphoryl diester phosphodiesterase